MLYKRGKRGVYYFDFLHRGVRHFGCTGVTNHDAAKTIESKKRIEVEESAAGLAKPKRIPLFSVGAQQYLSAKQGGWATKTHTIEKTNVAHLEPEFGNRLLNEISSDQVFTYRDQRIGEGAALKTVGLELATLRAILRHFDLDSQWRSINKHVKVATLKSKKKGRALTFAEEQALLDSCRQSRSRSILVATLLALDGCMRIDEVRHLRWVNVDLRRRTVTTDVSKTENGEDRVIPLTQRLHAVLSDWASQFPNRKPSHFLIPSEKYGEPKDGKPTVYATDPTHFLACYKYAWKEARERAGLQGFRFHDLRHSSVTRLFETGTPFAVVAKIAGWSEATMIRMSRVYGHIGDAAREQAMARLDQYRHEQEVLAARQISRQEGVSATTTIQ